MAAPDPLADLTPYRDQLFAALEGKDRAAAEPMLTDDFTMVGPDGRAIDRKQFLDGLADPQAPFPRHRWQEQRFRVLAANVIRESGELVVKGQFGERDVTGYYVYTATYVHTAPTWSLAEVTLTKLSMEVELQEYYDSCKEATGSKDRAALERLIHADYNSVDDRGNLIDREQLINSVLHVRTEANNWTFTEFHRTLFHAETGTVRDISEVVYAPGSTYMDPVTQRVRDVTGAWVYTALYVRGPEGDLQMFSNTMTKREGGAPAPAAVS